MVFEASGPQDLILGAALASRTEGGDETRLMPPFMQLCKNRRN